jgi:hypothetical protein
MVFKPMHHKGHEGPRRKTDRLRNLRSSLREHQVRFSFVLRRVLRGYRFLKSMVLLRFLRGYGFQTHGPQRTRRSHEGGPIGFEICEQFERAPSTIFLRAASCPSWLWLFETHGATACPSWLWFSNPWTTKDTKVHKGGPTGFEICEQFERAPSTISFVVLRVLRGYRFLNTAFPSWLWFSNPWTTKERR